jgi:hypothetical protein
MKNQAKALFDKMTDFKRFAITLLAVGSFLYLGLIIPSAVKSDRSLNIIILSSLVFLTLSVFFFIQSSICRERLLEMEEADEYLTRK